MLIMSRTYRIFQVFNYTILCILAVSCILPMIHILAVSFSGEAPATANLVKLWPIGFTLDAYRETVANPNFVLSIWISLQRTVFGTAIMMVLTFIAAYPLSKDDGEFRGRNIYVWYFVFTMLFSGGIVPMYILIVTMGLNNSLHALLWPPAVNVWLIILMLNFFRTIPRDLEDAALIDGAGPMRTMISVYIPLSLPSVATLSLFSMVFHWNSWFDGMIYNTDYRNYPLATFLQTVIVQQDFSKIVMDPTDIENISQRTVKSAQIFIGALPILMVYPFLQKYFVKGIVLGAVKE